MGAKLVRCKGCRRSLKKEDIRQQDVWSKREGKAKVMRICKFCGEIIREKK